MPCVLQQPLFVWFTQQPACRLTACCSLWAQEKIAAAVALDTPPDQLASYAAFLNCKPFLLESEVVGQLSDPGT